MPYPYLALQGQPLGKSLREDLRRARREAERRGPVGLQLVSAVDEDHLRSSIQCALEIHSAGWRGRNRTDILSDPAKAQFFREYALSAARDGTLRLSFLTIGDQRVAVHYGIESANSYWLLFIGYDEDYQECSPVIPRWGRPYRRRTERPGPLQPARQERAMDQTLDI